MKGFNPADMPLVIGGTREEIERVVEWQRMARLAFADYLRRMQMMCAHDEIDAQFMDAWTRSKFMPRHRVEKFEEECEAFCNYAMALGAVQRDPTRSLVRDDEPVLRGYRV